MPNREWVSRADVASQAGPKVAFGVDNSPGRYYASISVA